MNNIVLNDDQEKALDKLKLFVGGNSTNMTLLTGQAGSGKTTLVTTFLEWLLDSSLFTNVVLASPTHKALGVMKEMCPEEIRSKVGFSTLHSLLGLKHRITKDGKEIFERDRKVMAKLPFFDFVIIDETSMMADQLFEEIIEQNCRNTKILFVGDANQINPVNHTHAIPMLPDKRIEYSIDHINLEKIVRQAEGNPIIRFSKKVLDNDFDKENGYKDIVDGSGVVMLSDSQQNVLIKLIRHYFCSENFDNDANYCKFIAWRNVTVDYFNKLIRAEKYGLKAPKIVLNEKIIVDRPIKEEDSDNILFNTNEDLIVNQIEVKTKKVFNADFKYYKCLVTGYDKVDTIHILHESEQGKYDKILKDLSKDAAEENEISLRVKKWRKYFSFIESFANINYNYSVTIHSAQGSTYDNCFVMYSDIVLNHKKEERKRITYTAFTRPRKMLYII